MDTKDLLPLMAIPARNFTWTHGSQGSLTGVCDESDMPEHHTSMVRRGTNEFGFFVVGKTGSRLYTYRNTLRNGEGEVIAKVYVDVDRPQNQIHLIND